MATYDYVCLACERWFEEKRPMNASVRVAVACPSCGSDRVRRQFSFVAKTTGSAGPAAGGCACGGACACGH